MEVQYKHTTAKFAKDGLKIYLIIISNFFNITTFLGGVYPDKIGLKPLTFQLNLLENYERRRDLFNSAAIFKPN